MPVDRYQTLTNYRHPQDSNLLDVHRAMEYNTLGQPVIRTTSGAAPTANDAFGRLRISSPFTLFDSFHRYRDNKKDCVYVSGVASTSTHESFSSSILLQVGTDAGDKVYRETSRVFAYQPGKSLSILTTFCMSPVKQGLRQRVGYFDINNGIFLQRLGTETSFVIRSSSINGTVQEVEKVVQSQWNIDPLDGSGVSTKTLNLDTVQILFIDVQWLGVGTSRVGFVIDGDFVPVHVFHHANVSGNITTYMGTACLPVRTELENVTSTVSSSTYRQICTSVISEGGYELKGTPGSVGHSINAPRTNTNQEANIYFPVLSIRLKEGRDGAIVIPKNFSIAPTVAKNYSYRIVSGAITSGGSWVPASNDSSVEYNLTATTVTNGVVYEQGYIIATNQSGAAVALEDYPFKFQLERNTLSINTTTRYEFVLEVACSEAGGTLSSINWEEIT